MKKKLISFLLTLVMLVSLFSTFAISASADATVTTVKLGSGQTVLSLCQKAGIDYYAHKNLIMKLNGFTSEAQFSKLPVGSNIVLPVSNAAAASLSGTAVTAGTIANTTPGTIASNSSSWTAGATTTIPAGDYVSYYLVGYTIQKGETIAGIYNNWGLSYKTYSNQILKLNNLKNFNSIPSGKTLTLPTTNPAMAQSVYTTVMAHVMRGGDNAYNIICSDYNLNYNQVEKQVQSLNNRTNLAQFRVGEVMYIPIPGVVSSTTTVVPGTGTNAGSSSSSATVNPSAANNLVMQTATNGSFSLVVDGASASTAYAGKTVEVIATPSAGYALSGITVTKVGDNNTVVPVTGNRFVMPAYSVNIACSFTQAVTSKITINTTINGSASAMVNSKVVTSATAGNLVTVKTIPAAGFMLEHIRVTYNNGKDSIAVANNQFTMPTFPVAVDAIFKQDPNYDPAKGHPIYLDAAHGKVEVKIGNEAVSYAKKGERVTIVTTPDTNYTLQALTVYCEDFQRTIDVEKNSFTMPDKPVNIVATFTPTQDAAFALNKIMNSEGSFTLTVDGKEAGTAKVGQKVHISATSSKAFYNFIPTVYKTDDTSVTIPVAEDGTFTMPAHPVTVGVKFYIYRNIHLDASNGTYGWFNVTAAMNGMAINKCGAGVELKVTVWGVDYTRFAPSNVIVTYADGSVHTLSGSNFIMPDCDIKVRVNFTPVQKLVAHSITSQWRAGNSYTVQDLYADDNGEYAKETRAGQDNTVMVVPAPAIGYYASKVYYTVEGVSGSVNVARDPVSGNYPFQMPRGTTHVYVEFAEIPHYKINVSYDAHNADLHMGHITTSTKMGVVTSSAAGTKVNLLFSPAANCVPDYANIRIYAADGTDITDTEAKFNRNDFSFTMPARDVTIHVPFRSELNWIKLELASTTPGDNQPKGVISAIVNNVTYTDRDLNSDRYIPVGFKKGSSIVIVNESRDGYRLVDDKPILVTRVDNGAEVEVRPVDGRTDRFTFEMPDSNVTIRAQYQGDIFNINKKTSEFGTFEIPTQADCSTYVNITNITPKTGYVYDKIILNYTDHSGTKHEDEEITDTKFMVAGGRLPKTVVDVEVKFKPVLNPLTIKYIYDDIPSATFNYKVDVAVGETACTIERDTVSPCKTDKIQKASGIATDSTVRVSRQTNNLDENFKILSVWLEDKDRNKITPTISGGEYFFTMPYVQSGDPADLTMYVRYAKKTSDKFDLIATKTEGDGNVSVATRVKGDPGTIASVSEPITYVLTPAIDTNIELVSLHYKNSDGVEVELLGDPNCTVTTYSDRRIEVSLTNTAITSTPLDNALHLDYKATLKTAGKVEVRARLLDNNSGNMAYDESSTLSGVVDGAAQAGSMVTFKPVAKAGYELSGIPEVILTDTIGGDNTTVPVSGDAATGFSFEMPRADVTIQVKFAAKLTVTESAKGTVAITVDGAPFTPGTVLAADKTFVVNVTPAANYEVHSIKVTDADGELTPDGTNKYTMRYTTANVEVSYKGKVTYTVTGGTAKIREADDTEITSGSFLASGSQFKITDLTPADGYHSEAYRVIINEVPVTSATGFYTLSGDATEISIEFMKIDYTLNHTRTGPGADYGLLVKSKGITYTNSDGLVAKVQAGDTITIKCAREGFELKNAAINYPAIGNPSYQIPFSDFKKNDDGDYYVTLVEVPASAIVPVNLEIVFGAK